MTKPVPLTCIGGPAAGRQFAATTSRIELPLLGGGSVIYTRAKLRDFNGAEVEVWVTHDRPLHELVSEYRPRLEMLPPEPRLGDAVRTPDGDVAVIDTIDTENGIATVLRAGTEVPEQWTASMLTILEPVR